MSIGNHLVDMDHRLLICKINVIELALLLKEWLLVHVLKEDMKLKPFFNNYPKNLMP